MIIINHGKWMRYKPKEKPWQAPPNALFVKREKDDKDWYNFVHPMMPKEDSVFIACYKREDQWAVCSATRDPTELFPADNIVLEVTECEEEDLHERFIGKVYSVESNSIE